MAATPELADRAAYLPDADALLCADLHLGRAASGRVQLPLGQLTRIPERIRTLAGRFEPATIVLAGDILHAFDSIPAGVPAAIDAIEETATATGAELAFVRGNHDTMLPQVVEQEIHETLTLEDGTVVCHGHQQPERTATRFIIGHDHPAIVIEGTRRPCYLHGPGPAGTAPSSVFVLPAFTPLASGLTVNGADSDAFQSPLIEDVGAFRVAVRDDDAKETLWFPPLAEFREQL